MSKLINFGGRSLFDEFFRDVSPGYFVKPLHGDALPSQIRVDIKENEKAYSVQAEIPGVSKEDIHVSLDGGVVTLSAEIRQQDSQASNDQVLRSERYYGAVSRSFQLPQEIDIGNAKARYDNGVLMLSLPKKAQASSSRLAIE
ncbi:MAG: Hsp20/alpha crystallin family protein [Gammaproteobacteria bacterium]|jgi:HSP20 family protein|nr:Hsp20/alpha crystallin family protein [Gammaproteobacteria bacterium]